MSGSAEPSPGRSSRSRADLARALTRRHYDKYPFWFDQDEILDEKLHHRIMGKAILELAAPPALVLDVGSGMCRVAEMVRRAVAGRVVSLDGSLETLRRARSRSPGPLVNGDNMRLPLRSDCADLVISNGVIMVTPDAATSFFELARITRPGGTLVVSVYHRKSWYYYLYRYAGAVVRWMQRRLGDRFLKVTLFPLHHLGVLVLMSAVRRKLYRLPVEQSWYLFHDQFTTPHCTFHTFEELDGWVRQAGLVCEERGREAANQLITYRMRKPMPPGAQP